MPIVLTRPETSYKPDRLAINQPNPDEIETPPALDVAASAFRQTNIVSSLYDRVANRASGLPDEPTPGYDPLDDITGFDAHADRFLESASPQETAAIKQQISAELADQKVLRDAGGWGLASSIAAGVVDPATLASIAIPAAAPTRAAGLFRGAVTSGILDTASEVALHQTRETRTVGQSAFNVAAGAVLNGLIGSAVSGRVSRDEFDTIAGKLAKDLNAPVQPFEGSTGGAAARGFATTLEDETIAAGGEYLAKTIGNISPLSRVMTSVSKSARQLAQRIAELPYALKKNEAGIATTQSVETRVKQYDAMLAKAVVDLDKGYKAYRERVKAAGGQAMRFAEFRERVAASMRRGDASDIPEVAAAAGRLRSEIIDTLTKQAQETGVLVDPVKKDQARLERKAVEDYVKAERSQIYTNYSARTLAADEKAKPLSKRRFIKAAEKVNKKGTPHEIAEVNDLAKLLKEQETGGLASRVTVPQTKVTGLKTVGAQSYLPRLYNTRAIKARRVEWNAALQKHFVREGMDEAEAALAVEDVTNTILGTTRGFAQVDPTFVPKSGPLKDRTLNVPDEILEPFLVNDIEQVISRYVRTLAPQIEMARELPDVLGPTGSFDLQKVLQGIIDEYGVLKARTADNAKLAKLDEAMTRDLKDITEMFNRVMGKAGIPNDPDSMWVRSGRLFRTYSYVRLLGSQVLSSIADVGRTVTRHGMGRTLKALGTFATNLDRAKLAGTDAKRMAIGLDWVLNTRGSTLADISDFAGDRAQDTARRFSNQFSRVTLMAPWNAAMKFLTTALEQDALLRAAAKGAPGPRATTKAAELGIGEDMLKRIGAQFAKHGDDGEGLLRARTELWDDQAAAKALELALLKSADTVILTRGAGDLPRFMSSELAQTIFQFKGFGMAATNRLLIPIAQGLAAKDAAVLNGLLLMLALGTARYVTKQWTSGQPIDTSPGVLSREALDGAGLTAYLADAYDIPAALVGAPRWSRFADRSWVETLMGPTVGSITDVGLTIQDVTGSGITQRDIHKFRRLLPYQNLFYLRRAINALEEGTGEAFGVPAQTQ